MFHLVSLSLQISLTFAWLSPWPVCVWVVVVACLVGLVFGLFFFGEICFQLQAHSSC